MTTTKKPYFTHQTELINELVSKEKCHTIILYGSFARGDYNSNSDIDVIGICQEGDFHRIVRTFHGFALDVFIYSEENLPSADKLLQISSGFVLLEKDSLGTDLIRSVNAILNEPPPLPKSWEVQTDLVWIEKMLSRASVGDVEGDFRRHWLLITLLEYWFSWHKMHYLGSKQSLKYLELEQPQVFELFKAALRPTASLSDIRLLADTVRSAGKKMLELCDVVT